MKILIINFRHIGDALLTTPLIANLTNAYPNARIDYCLNSECASMVQDNPSVAHIWRYERKSVKGKGLFGRLRAEASFALAIRKERYDMVINTTEGERGAQIAFLSGASVRIGMALKKGIFSKLGVYTHSYRPRDMCHTVEANLDALRCANIPITSKAVWLFCTSHDDTIVAKMLSDAAVKGAFVQMHPTSRWMFKCLPVVTIAQIIDFLQQQMKITVVLTAAPNEEEMQYINSVTALCITKPVDFSGQLSLTQMVSLSRRAKLFFGVDSAPMHIAASQNTPCIAVFGPSGAFNWGPWDNRQKESGYTKRSGVQRMGIHTVVQVEWKCAPCGHDGCNGSKKSDCLEKLDIKSMVNELELHFF